MEFLSDEWFDAANGALAEFGTGTSAVVIEHQLTDEDDDTIYQLVVSEGVARLTRGAERPADVTLRQNMATALAVRSGSINALEAVQSGDIVLHGDPRALIAAGEVLGAIDRLLSELNI